MTHNLVNVVRFGPPGACIFIKRIVYNFFMNSQKMLMVMVAMVGSAWLLNFVLFKPVRFVSLCQNTPFMVCEIAEAEYRRDSMDGVFLIKRIYPHKRKMINFSPMCVIPSSGGQCSDSSTGEKFDIVTTAFTLRAWRWEKAPYPEKY
jgi:hypothetical protein